MQGGHLLRHQRYHVHIGVELAEGDTSDSFPGCTKRDPTSHRNEKDEK